jgi:methionyl-tRNA formyltransferase
VKIAVIGRTQMLFQVIKLLEQTEHQIVIIGTCKESPEYTVKSSDYERAANEKGIPFFCTQNINTEEIVDKLYRSSADIAISMNWISMIGEDVIRCFKYGILNIHPGDLPRYRGNACPNWAILNGEDKIGITIHYMDANKLDAGNIVLKDFIYIDDNTTIGYVYKELENRIPQLFLRAISIVEKKGSKGEKQDNDSLRCYPRKPCDGRIEWEKSIVEIQRLVQASGFPFAGAYTYCNDKKIIIKEVQIEPFREKVFVVPGQVIVIDKSNNRIGIAASDGIVTIREGYIEGHENIRLCDFIRSTRMRMGYIYEDEIYNLKKEIAELKNMCIQGK